MIKKLGTPKAKHWMASGRIPWRPDSLMGSEEPEHIEWGAPVEYERWLEDEEKFFKMSAKSQTDEDDLAILGITDEPAPAEAPKAIKIEPKDPAAEFKNCVLESMTQKRTLTKSSNRTIST